MRRTLPALLALLAMLAPAATLAAERYRCAAMGTTMDTPCCPSTAEPERAPAGPELRRLPCCDREPASITAAEPRVEIRSARDLSPLPPLALAATLAVPAPRLPSPPPVPARAGAPPPAPAPAFLLHASLLL